MANEEAASLLDNGTRRQPERSGDSRRAQALRVAVGIISALSLVAGSVIAVEMIGDSQHQQQQQHQFGVMQTSSLTVTAPAPASMEANFGWGTWCSVRAAAGCLFSSDKKQCKEEVMQKCDPDEAKVHADHGHGGDGSGSGSGWGSGSGSGSDWNSGRGGVNVGDDEHNGTNHK